MEAEDIASRSCRIYSSPLSLTTLCLFEGVLYHVYFQICDTGATGANGEVSI
jgi:hypothetical protein